MNDAYYERADYVEKAKEGAKRALENRNNLIKKYVPSDARNLVEIGCGAGVLQDCHENYWGVDISETALKNLGNRGIRCDVNEEKLPFDDGSVDAIISFWTLEHIYGIENLLNECDRILAKDGVLLFNNTWIYSPWLYPENKFPKREFLRGGILRLIDEVGYKLSLKIKARIKHRAPNYESIEPDADAVSLIDPHNIYAWFKSRHYRALNEADTFWKRIRFVFRDENDVVVVKKGHV